MSPQKTKYLIIDDDAVDRALIRRILNNGKYSGEVIEADSAATAMEMLSGLVFDCIFLDYRLPQQDGMSLLKWIRSKDIKSSVVMMTGMGDERLAVEFMKAGASDYIAKSQIDDQAISHVLQNLVRLHEAEAARSLAEDALRENQRALSTLMSNLPGMAYRSRPDKGRTIEFASEGCHSLTGFDSDSFLTNNIIYTNIIHPEDRKRVNTTISGCLEQGRRFQAAYRIFSREGRVKWVWEQGCGVYTHQGDLIAIEGFVTDISERVAFEDEIKEKNHKLEDLMNNLEHKVTERTRDLEEANAELFRLNKIKTEFLSIVSHELRTPLTSIKSFAEILLDDIDDVDVDTARNYLGIIDSEADRLARLISNLLDLQKIDAGKMTWHDEMTDIIELARASMQVFEGAYRDKNLSLNLKSDMDQLYSVVDRDKIRQVFSNLFSNALKFTDDGGVEIRIDVDGSSGEHLLICITDTGLGIPDEELEKVFERFHQVDQSQTRRYGGTGLGLGICKEIVEHYQGRIWAERGDNNQGTRMSLMIPLAENQLPREASASG
ncbi:MAG: hybrid sensor histidine kinase/response regulator [Gammaproteobacteria bacterium]|nr:hybrid sensor histidine kinase/response regulator [Gammaproteobacteria bacterium]